MASAFMALKDGCRLPDGSRYIVSIDGGNNNSPEGLSKGMEVGYCRLPCKGRSVMSLVIMPFQHAFVATFRSTEERDYYLDTDPVHQAFKASIAEKVSDVVVFDFSSGEFTRRAAMKIGRAHV